MLCCISLQDAIYKGNLTAQFQNLLRPDAMVLGNHEFDFGSRAASTYVRWVGSNIYWPFDKVEVTGQNLDELLQA